MPRVNTEPVQIGQRRACLAGTGKKKIETPFHNDLLSLLSLSLRERVFIKAPNCLPIL
jgi:hypothetical protein